METHTEQQESEPRTNPLRDAIVAKLESMVRRHKNPMHISNFMTDKALKPAVSPLPGKRSLHMVSLSAHELDKFENATVYSRQDFSVMAVFCSDPHLDFCNFKD